MFDDEFLDVLFGKITELHSTLPTTTIITQSEGGFNFTFTPDNSDGFAVEFVAQRGEYWLTCMGWHEHSEAIGLDAAANELAKSQRAFDQITSLLNGQAMLEVISAGKFAHKWVLHFENSTNTNGLLLYPFWLKKSSKLYKNIAPVKRISSKPWQ